MSEHQKENKTIEPEKSKEKEKVTEKGIPQIIIQLEGDGVKTSWNVSKILALGMLEDAKVAILRTFAEKALQEEMKKENKRIYNATGSNFLNSLRNTKNKIFK